MDIRRYNPAISYALGDIPCIDWDRADDGEYVRAEDHDRLVDALRFELEIAEHNRLANNRYLLDKIDSLARMVPLWHPMQDRPGIRERVLLRQGDHLSLGQYERAPMRPFWYMFTCECGRFGPEHFDAWMSLGDLL